MSTLLNGQAFQDSVGLIIFFGVTFAVYRISKSSKLPSQTIKNLQDSNASLITLDATRQKEMEQLRQEVHANNTAHNEEVLRLNKEISELTGQIKVYKELPLQKLADGIQKVADSNDKILTALENSAIIAANSANDGGLLVKTKPNTPVTVKMEESK